VPTQPPIQWVPGALSLRVKRLGREADHSPPSSVEIKERVELYLPSPIRLHGVALSYKKRSTGTTLPSCISTECQKSNTEARSVYFPYAFFEIKLFTLQIPHWTEPNTAFCYISLNSYHTENYFFWKWSILQVSVCYILSWRLANVLYEGFSRIKSLHFR
jgi:hypothetical protein